MKQRTLKQRTFFFAPVLLAVVFGSSWAQEAASPAQQESPVTFSSWGRVVITPLAVSDKYSAVSAGTTTWGDVPYISFSANGKAPSGNIGFNIDFDFGYDNENSQYNIVGDNAKAWVYPLGLLLPGQFNMLKLVAGRFREEELRGRIGATEFSSWILPNGSKDEDNIFTRLKAEAGAYVRLEPLKWLDSPWNGLTLHAVFGSNFLGAMGNRVRAILNLYNNEANDTGATWPGGVYEESPIYNRNGKENRDTKAGDVFRAGQYALGYRIPDVGLARFQFIGSNRNVWRLGALPNGAIVDGTDKERPLVTGIDRGDVTKNADVIEFAFLYDGLSGLKVDIGAKLPREYTTNNKFEVIPPVYFGRIEPNLQSEIDDEYSVQLPNIVSLGVNWTPSFLPDLNIVSRFDYSFGGKIEQVKKDRPYSLNETGSSFSAWFIPSYKIIPNFTFGFDFGMEIKQTDNLIKEGKNYTEFGGFIVKDSNGRETNPTEWTDFGFAPWIELGVGGGKVRTGVVVMMPGSPRYKPAEDGRVNYKFKGDPVISVPISITYSF